MHVKNSGIKLSKREERNDDEGNGMSVIDFRANTSTENPVLQTRTTDIPYTRTVPKIKKL